MSTTVLILIQFIRISFCSFIMRILSAFKERIVRHKTTSGHIKGSLGQSSELTRAKDCEARKHCCVQELAKYIVITQSCIHTLIEMTSLKQLKTYSPAHTNDINSYINNKKEQAMLFAHSFIRFAPDVICPVLDTHRREALLCMGYFHFFWITAEKLSLETVINVCFTCRLRFNVNSFSVTPIEKSGRPPFNGQWFHRFQNGQTKLLHGRQ